MLTALVLVTGLFSGAMAIGTPMASAVSTGPLCQGDRACSCRFVYSSQLPDLSLPATLSYAWPDRSDSIPPATSTGQQTKPGEGISQADVFRASKDNEPGQERILYQQSRPATSPVDFEAITYANVGGTWYGYFVANYPRQKKSRIMRVPLAGGAAVVLATSPAVIGDRDLVTDWSFLYWADANGIRRMAITGGRVQRLVSGKTFAHLGIDGPVLVLLVPRQHPACADQRWRVHQGPVDRERDHGDVPALGDRRQRVLGRGRMAQSRSSPAHTARCTSSKLRAPVSESRACRSQTTTSSGATASPAVARSMDTITATSCRCRRLVLRWTSRVTQAHGTGATPTSRNSRSNAHHRAAGVPTDAGCPPFVDAVSRVATPARSTLRAPEEGCRGRDRITWTLLWICVDELEISSQLFSAGDFCLKLGCEPPAGEHIAVPSLTLCVTTVPPLVGEEDRDDQRDDVPSTSGPDAQGCSHLGRIPAREGVMSATTNPSSDASVITEQQVTALLGSDVREGYADIGEVRLHYVEAGEGPLIVLLHGFPEFWYGWRLQIRPLAGGRISGRRTRHARLQAVISADGRRGVRYRSTDRRHPRPHRRTWRRVRAAGRS